jgi:hypothetical protein
MRVLYPVFLKSGETKNAAPGQAAFICKAHNKLKGVASMAPEKVWWRRTFHFILKYITSCSTSNRPGGRFF